MQPVGHQRNSVKIYLDFVFFILDLSPFFSNSIALMLSWYNMFLLIPYPCDSKKYLVHSICGVAPSSPMSSASVDLFVFIFYLLDIMIIDPCPFFPIGIFSPVCPCILS